MPHHNEIHNDGIGNKLRIELFDSFELTPDRVGFIPTNNNFQEKDFVFDDRIEELEEIGTWLVSFRQRNTSLMYLTVSERSLLFMNGFERTVILLPTSLMILWLYIFVEVDYLTNSANHHNLSLKYYEKALEHFDSDRQVIIFSDDPEWCMEQELFR